MINKWIGHTFSSFLLFLFARVPSYLTSTRKGERKRRCLLSPSGEITRPGSFVDVFSRTFRSITLRLSSRSYCSLSHTRSPSFLSHDFTTHTVVKEIAEFLKSKARSGRKEQGRRQLRLSSKGRREKTLSGLSIAREGGTASISNFLGFCFRCKAKFSPIPSPPSPLSPPTRLLPFLTINADTNATRPWWVHGAITSHRYHPPAHTHAHTHTHTGSFAAWAARNFVPLSDPFVTGFWLAEPGPNWNGAATSRCMSPSIFSTLTFVNRQSYRAKFSNRRLVLNAGLTWFSDFCQDGSFLRGPVLMHYAAQRKCEEK